VNRFASVLKRLGVRRNDRVAIYLPQIPEVAIAMLACARIGAPHSVVFGCFSAQALRDRINDAGAKVLITADGGYRRGQIVPLKRNADEVLAECATITDVVVVRRVGDEAFAHMTEGRDHWWHRLMEDASDFTKPEAMDAEDATTRYVFDLKQEDVFWCTADVGWVTGHSYIVYGPLARGRGIRDAQGWAQGERRAEGRPQGPGRPLHWRHRAAGRHLLQRRPSQDPQRKDHAATASGHRRGPSPR